MYKILVKSPICCGTIDFDLQGQIELETQTLPHFEPVRMISHHQFKSVFPNFDQKCILALLRSILILSLIDLDIQFHFSFQTCYFTIFCVSYSLASVSIYLVRLSSVSDPHATWLCTYSDSYMLADRVRRWPWNCLVLYFGETIGVQPASTRRLPLGFTSSQQFSPKL